MSNANNAAARDDRFKLERFVSAQEQIYPAVIAELRGGRKRSHWMWFIFPQVEGLGYSATSKHYAIKSAAEARAYLRHPILGARLLECSEALLALSGRSAYEVFGSPDDVKLKSSMTLFEAVSEPGSPFARVLDQYFGGQRDDKTLALLAERP